MVDERDFYHRQTTNIYTLTRYAKCLLIVFSNVRLPSVKGKRVGHRITNPTRMKHQPLIVSRQQCLLHCNLLLANCIRRQIGCLHFGFYSLFFSLYTFCPAAPLHAGTEPRFCGRGGWHLFFLLQPLLHKISRRDRPTGCLCACWIMSCASCSFNLS